MDSVSRRDWISTQSQIPNICNDMKTDYGNTDFNESMSDTPDPNFVHCEDDNLEDKNLASQRKNVLNFDEENDLIRHPKDIYNFFYRNKIIHCEDCNQKIPRNSSYEEHKRTSCNIIRTWKCDLCEKILSSKHCLYVHKKVVHSENYRFKCHLCDYKSKYKVYLQVHIDSIHSKKYSYKCDLCDVKFLNIRRLYYHNQTKHRKPGDIKRFPCDLCDYEATTAQSLKTHVQAVHLKFKGRCTQISIFDFLLPKIVSQRENLEIREG